MPLYLLQPTEKDRSRDSSPLKERRIDKAYHTLFVHSGTMMDFFIANNHVEKPQEEVEPEPEPETTGFHDLPMEVS